MAKAVVGIVREWKTDAERRAPLTPDDVRRLSVEHRLAFVVEPSSTRVHADGAYREAGAEVSSDLSSCDFLLGIKEFPVDRLHAGKPHLFFSHTHKGQTHNRPLLRAVLERRVTLLDYELVTDDEGLRLIFFGRQAGQAGMLNSLWALGQRLAALGIETPFRRLRQARCHESLEEARAALRKVGAEIRRKGLPAAVAPLVVGITGIGNVSQGAQDILGLLEPATLTPEELLAGRADERPELLWQVVFRERHMVRRLDPSVPWDRAEYRAHPERFAGRFHDYVPHLSVLVAGNYWDDRYPRLVTRDFLARHFAPGRSPRLVVIGDVSCDVEGGVECTLKATYPDDPVYIYDPRTRRATDGFAGEGVCVMAVEILPSELPRESSQAFGAFLRPYLPQVAAADYGRPLSELDLPAPFMRAVVAHRGELAPRFRELRT